MLSQSSPGFLAEIDFYTSGIVQVLNDSESVVELMPHAQLIQCAGRETAAKLANKFHQKCSERRLPSL